MRVERRPAMRIGLAALAIAALAAASCGKGTGGPLPSGEDPQVRTLGTIEVTARLSEIPEGAIFKRDLYDYATILRYEVLAVHRGALDREVIHVGHYNPFKPRAEAPDRRVKTIGGNLRRFEAGQVHRMALEVPLDDFYMGGIVNKYFGEDTGPLYWAVWTNLGRAP